MNTDQTVLRSNYNITIIEILKSKNILNIDRIIIGLLSEKTRE